MSDWERRLEAAEAGAEHLQAAEHEAEERFKAVQAEAKARGDADAALQRLAALGETAWRSGEIVERADGAAAAVVV